MTDAHKVCGVGTDTISGKTYKSLYITETLNNAKAAFKDQTGASYVVTTGKTFYMSAFQPVSVSNSAAVVNIVYADDSAFTTNLVYCDICWMGSVGESTLAMPVSIFPITIPAGKYVGLYQSYASGIAVRFALFGHEE